MRQNYMQTNWNISGSRAEAVTVSLFPYRYTDLICPRSAMHIIISKPFKSPYMKKHTVIQLCVKMAPWMNFFLNSCAVNSVNEGLMGRNAFCLIREGSVKNTMKLVMEWREHKKNKWRVRRRGKGRECRYSWCVTLEIWRLLFAWACKA